MHTAMKRVGTLRADWHHPTRILFGVGRAAEMPVVCRHLGMHRPLMVTDAGLSRLPISEELVAANIARGIPTGLFAGVRPDPDGDCIVKGARAYKDGGHDGILALGGGSAMDAGKAVALASAVGPEGIWGFVFCQGKPPPPVRKGCIPPIVAVPTTAGTGSEVNAGAVITNTEHRAKRSLFHPDLLPAAVIADPALNRGLSPHLTAATGMDALSHNLEALCAPGFHPMLDAVALQGLRFAHDWLPVAVREPRSLRSRVYTMASSMMGAVAFEKGLGAMHAMAHAVGVRFKTHHGRTVGVVMPYVLRFNRRRIEEQMALLGRFLGLPGSGYQGVMDRLLALRSELGIPATLAKLGVRQAHIPALVERTLTDANAPTNPVPLDAKGAERLFRWAVQGDL